MSINEMEPKLEGGVTLKFTTDEFRKLVTNLQKLPWISANPILTALNKAAQKEKVNVDKGDNAE